MKRWGVWGLAASLVGLWACGPSVSETRMGFFPPREANCQLEFLQSGMQEVMDPNGRWQLVGHISVGETGTQDPFSQRYRDLVRPRACAMGGTAIVIMASNSNPGGYGYSSSTGTVYTVVRPRQAPSAGPPGPPQQF